MTNANLLNLVVVFKFKQYSRAELLETCLFNVFSVFYSITYYRAFSANNNCANDFS